MGVPARGALSVFGGAVLREVFRGDREEDIHRGGRGDGGEGVGEDEVDDGGGTTGNVELCGMCVLPEFLVRMWGMGLERGVRVGCGVGEVSSSSAGAISGVLRTMHEYEKKNILLQKKLFLKSSYLIISY